MSHFRPIRPAAGNLVARCRVINASRFFTYTEAEVEDPFGRQLLRASSHAAIRAVEPEPPPAPAELRRVDEPTYASPDPCHRPLTVGIATLSELVTGDVLDRLNKYADATLTTPFVELIGVRILHIDVGAARSSFPATEWFCLFSRNVSHGALATLGNTNGTLAGQSLTRAGDSFVGLSQNSRFLGEIPADGRPFIAETTGHLRAEDRASVEVATRDSEGRTIVLTSGVAHFVDAAKRQRAIATATKRVLCSLLFTDIVNSTQHAERLADQRWHALLDEQRKKVRAEIARYGGTEIDTAGDGFFVRFDSPADALDCAVAAVHAVKPLGIDIRAGVHTGECEVTGRSYAGMAVHLGARIMAAAGPGEILVSSTVKDLVMGSGRNFEDRGEHSLKGVPGTWRLHTLV
jgi:class 3 adenylate cyclase